MDQVAHKKPLNILGKMSKRDQAMLAGDTACWRVGSTSFGATASSGGRWEVGTSGCCKALDDPDCSECNAKTRFAAERREHPGIHPVTGEQMFTLPPSAGKANCE